MKTPIKNLFYPIRKIASHFVNTGDIANTKMLKPIDLAADYVCSEGIPGDYLEFGVFKGNSFIEAYRRIEHSIGEWSSFRKTKMAYTDRSKAEEAHRGVIPRAMRYFAFDSFRGLPELRGIDKEHQRLFEGRYDCSEELFRTNLRNNKVDAKKIVIVPGYYNQTLTDGTKKRFGLKSASIIMVDCDLYESSKIALDFITDLVVDGTVIIFDDWFAFRGNPNFGEQRACREWLDKNPDLSLTQYARWGPWQTSFIINKKEKNK